MVEKPTEGLCANCNSDSLVFYDDGTGECLNCGREFRWDEEEYEEKKEPKTAATASPPPRREPTRAVQRNTKFVNIAMLGFSLMIVGYIIVGFMYMGFEIDQDIINILQGLYIILIYTGVLLIGAGLVYGAATAEYLENRVRAWMIVAMAVLLGLFLTFNSMNFLSVFTG